MPRRRSSFDSSARSEETREEAKKTMNVRARGRVRPKDRVRALRAADSARGPDLAALFLRLNRKHFGGKLPPFRIVRSARWSPDLDEVRLREETMGEIFFKETTIRIRPGLPETEEQSTLLHEMIHLWCGPSGGHAAAFHGRRPYCGRGTICHGRGTGDSALGRSSSEGAKPGHCFQDVTGRNR
jgi:hypothetical protein